MSPSPPPASGAPIELTCPRCGAAQRLPASAAGTRQVCTACQQTFKVPAAGLFTTTAPGKPASVVPLPPRPAPPAPPAPPGAAKPNSAPRGAAPPAPPLVSEAEVVDLTERDEAPIPFDSLDEEPRSALRPAAAPPNLLTPPSPPAAPKGPSPKPPREESGVDRDTFYDAGGGAPRPAAKTASRMPILLDNKHRVFNDEGLILVVCGVCGTRVHFPANKAHTGQQCPDCFTKFVLPDLPPGLAEQKSAPPPAGEEEEFKLEETFERQGYQPLHRDSVAAELVHGPVNPPQPQTPGAAIAPPPTGGAPSYGNVIAPPLPPPIGASSPTPPPPSFASPDATEHAPTMVNPESRLARPPKWAVMTEVFDFLFRPLHLLCWISFTILIMIPITIGIFAISVSSHPVVQVILAAVIPPLEAAPFVFVASYFVHIVHDSSYGERQVQHWSAIQLVDNGIMAIYVFCAFFFAGLPGFLLSLPFTGSESNFQALFILVSAAVFFPFCLLSLLEEESYWQTYNREVALSFRRSKDQAFLFYCTLLVFGGATGGLMFGVSAAAMSIMGEQPSPTITVIAVAVEVLIGLYWFFTYARMIGRLAWVMNYEAQFGPIDDDD